jgi:hypothetical protein
MKQSITKFLEFNGKNLVFLSNDGTYYVAVKPICEALQIDYIEQFKDIKKDSILGPVLCKHTIQIPGDQGRSMICLPEKYIYGWLFSVKSESLALLEYKRKCYELLYDYFHGSITQRKKLIRDKAEIQIERAELEKGLRVNESFLRWESLKAAEARLGKDLKEVDNTELSEQLELFSN